MKIFTLILALLAATVAHAQFQFPPMPSPLEPPSSSGGGGGGGTITGTCGTINAIAYFDAAQNLTCNASLTTDGSGRLRTADGSSVAPSHSFTSNTTMGMYLGGDPNFPGTNATILTGGDQLDLIIGAPVVYGSVSPDFTTIMGTSVVVATTVIANQNQTPTANIEFDEWCNADATFCGLEIVAADASGHYDLHFHESATATTATASQAQFHDDSVSHRLQLSNNGGAYSTVVTTGESETFTSTSWTFSNDMTMTLSGATERLFVSGSQNASTQIDVINATNGTGASAELRATNNPAGAEYLALGYGAALNSSPEFADRAYESIGTGASGFSTVIGDNTKDWRFYFGSPPTAVELGRMTASAITLGTGNGATGTHSYGIVGNSSSFFTATTSSTTASPDVELYRSRGTTAAPSAVQSGDELGAYYGGGYTGSAYTVRSRISFRATQNWSATAVGNSIVFSTATNGTTTQTDRLTIGNDGTITSAGTLALSGVTTDITTGTNENLTIAPNGTGVIDFTKHLSGANAQAPSAGGTCTNPIVVGTDIRGDIAADACAASETVIVTFGVTYGTAPNCTAVAVNSSTAQGQFFVSASATAMTITSVAGTGGVSADWTYFCIK